MADQLSLEHTTFGQMGPVTHTATRNMPIHSVIFQVGERVILLDTGFGTREMQDPNRLLGEDALFKLGIMVDMRLTALERLRSRGVRPEQVTDIILTHLDNDHAGGLHDFPNATVHLSEEELASYDGTRPRGPYKPYQLSHLTKFKTYGKTDETWFGCEARSLQLSNDLEAKLIPLPGHTMGHCGVAYREEGRWSLHAGDAYFDSKVIFWSRHPGYRSRSPSRPVPLTGRQVLGNCRHCARNTRLKWPCSARTTSRISPTGPWAEAAPIRSVRPFCWFESG